MEAMTPQDPARLSTLTTVPELAETIRAARGVSPAPELVARLAERLAANGAPVSSDAPGGRPNVVSPLAPKTFIAGKLVLGTISLLAIGIALWIAFSPRARPVVRDTTSAPIPIASVAPPPATVASAAIALPAPPASSTRSTARPEHPSELALVSEAERSRLDAPAKSFALTEEHARLYPHGLLAEERDVLAIEALARLGRLPRAKDLAQRFAARYPGSAYTKRIERALASDDQK